MENTTIANTSKRALAIVAVLCMISAAFVGVAFAYTATYTDTIEETPIETEYILVTGGDMKYLGETITVNLNTATTPDKDSDGSYVTADGDYKNTTVYTFSSVNGNVDAQGNIDIELGNVKITNVSTHPKTIYFGHEVGTRTVTAGNTSILDDTSLSFVYLRTTDLMDGTTVVQAAGTPITQADFAANGELTLSVHMKGKVSTAAITSAVNNATTALPSFVLPSFTLKFIADAGSTVVSSVTTGVPFEAQVVNKTSNVVTKVDFTDSSTLASNTVRNVAVTEVTKDVVTENAYAVYTESQFLGGISVVATDVKTEGSTTTETSVSGYMSGKPVTITFSNIEAADVPNIVVFHESTKIIENSASLVSGVTVGTDAYNATDKTFTFTTTLGFSSYVAFLKETISYDEEYNVTNDANLWETFTTIKNTFGSATESVIVNLKLADGTYHLRHSTTEALVDATKNCNNLTIVFSGNASDRSKVILESSYLTHGIFGYVEGPTLKFNDLTLQNNTTDGSGNYGENADGWGFVRAGAIYFDNCIIEGMYQVVNCSNYFNNCLFKDNEVGCKYHNVVIYGCTEGSEVEFVGCTFETAGKAAIQYVPATNSSGPGSVLIDGCTFKYCNGDSGKNYGALYVYLNRADVTITMINETPENFIDFDKGTKEKTEVTVDGYDHSFTTTESGKNVVITLNGTTIFGN